MPYLIKTLLVRTCERTDGPIEQKDASHLIRYRGYRLEKGVLIQRTRFQPQTVGPVWLVPGPGEAVRLADVVPVEEQVVGCS